jgi:hypothetical protein
MIKLDDPCPPREQNTSLRLPEPSTVTVLIVTDFLGSFGSGAFSFKEVIDTLQASSSPWVKFNVIARHRQMDPSSSSSDSGTQSFVFTPEAIDGVDEIWLFGTAGFAEVRQNGKSARCPQAPRLDDSELLVLVDFMSKGGGVFATGDHEDMGVLLCGRIPRVRSMRKWYWPDEGPHGEPVAPIGPANRFNVPRTAATTRHDTLRPGEDLVYQFDDQSDTTPQIIEPRVYSCAGLPGRNYPHPVLCSPEGVMNVLPDHNHEGECYIDDDLDKRLHFGESYVNEYPVVDGTRVKPEIIAWATVIGGHTSTSDDKIDFPVVKAKRFGAIGAYDGHKVRQGGQRLGRVVVDSSLHHFARINLHGDLLGGSTDEKKHGFDFSDAGKFVLDRIRSYYRNIAFWLAMPDQHTTMLTRAVWWARWQYPLSEELPAGVSRNVITFQAYGRMARRTLGQIISPCLVDSWAICLFRHVAHVAKLEHLVASLDPWHQGSEDDGAPSYFPDGDKLLDILIGGAIVEVAAECATSGSEPISAIQGRLDAAVSQGAAEGFQLFLGDLKDRNEKTEAFLQIAHD